MKKQHALFLSGSLLAWCLASPAVQAAPSGQEVKAQVMHVNLRLTEQNVAEVEVSGLVKNLSPLAVRGVQLEIELLDPEQKPVRRFFIDPYARMNAGSSERFKAAYTVREYPYPYMSARADLHYETTSLLQIADWILARNASLLSLWNVAIPDAVLDNERARVDLAQKYMRQVPPHAPEYPEAMRKWNLTGLNYGKRLLESHSLHEALLTLANIEPNSEYHAEAYQLFEQSRLRTIFTRAMEKAVHGNLKGAFRQMQYIPEGSSYSAEARQKETEWQALLAARHIHIRPVPPPYRLSRDQRSVWLRQQHGPEGVTTSVREDGTRLTTWWYLDYSHFSFDHKGRLLNSVVY